MSSLLLLELAWLVFAALFLLRFANNYWQLRQESSWPHTQGEISYCQLSEQGRHLHLDIRYQYTVDQQPYLSDVINSSHDPSSGFSKQKRHFYYQLIRHFEAHESIDVYYNPKSPGECVLYRGQSNKLLAYCALLLLFIGWHSYQLFA